MPHTNHCSVTPASPSSRVLQRWRHLWRALLREVMLGLPHVPLH